MQTSSPYVVPLGVAAALTDVEHANSFLAIVRQGRYWLVDCADNPVGRLRHAGLNPLDVQGIIITHMHPDHVYGLPAYLLGLFLRAIKNDAPIECPIPIYARPEVLEGVRALIQVFDSQHWLEKVPLTYHAVTPEEGALVCEDTDFSITASPSAHSVPSLALRFEDRATGRAAVYSSDTALSEAVERLAQGASLLLHEATGDSPPHTTPEEAGALAARAGVDRLVLMHYEPEPDREAATRDAAHKAFGGPAELARAFKRYPW